MQIGLVIANEGPEAVPNVRDLPAQIEALGYASVWFTDHVIGLRAYEPVYGPIWAEALTAMTFAVARTTRIQIGIGVLVVPYRPAVYTAKVLATLDQLSGGRIIVGAGVGWARREYAAMGLAPIFADRGAYTDECLEVMLACWRGGQLSYEGRWHAFQTIEFEPRPLQQPHPPLWIGGQTGRALRRAARFAEVWHPTGITPVQMQQLGEQLDGRAGRPIPRSIRMQIPAAFEVEEIRERLAAYERAGCIAAAIDLKAADQAEFLRAAERLAALLPSSTVG